jgi:RNA polymerase sigma-70 factor (ECF subfamily)
MAMPVKRQEPEPLEEDRETPAPPGETPESPEEHRDAIRDVVRMRGVPAKDIDDVVQITMVQFIRGLSKFRGESKLSTWAVRIANREASNYHRNARREPIYLSDPVDGPSRDASPEDRAQLAEIAQRLSLEQHELFVLRYDDGLTLEELARALDVSVSTVKRRLRKLDRTLARIRKELKTT